MQNEGKIAITPYFTQFQDRLRNTFVYTNKVILKTTTQSKKIIGLWDIHIPVNLKESEM